MCTCWGRDIIEVDAWNGRHPSYPNDVMVGSSN
jgi:hypothetical protein